MATDMFAQFDNVMHNMEALGKMASLGMAMQNRGHAQQQTPAGPAPETGDDQALLLTRAFHQLNSPPGQAAAPTVIPPASTSAVKRLAAQLDDTANEEMKRIKETIDRLEKRQDAQEVKIDDLTQGQTRMASSLAVIERTVTQIGSFIQKREAEHERVDARGGAVAVAGDGGIPPHGGAAAAAADAVALGVGGAAAVMIPGIGDGRQGLQLDEKFKDVVVTDAKHRAFCHLLQIGVDHIEDGDVYEKWQGNADEQIPLLEWWKEVQSAKGTDAWKRSATDLIGNQNRPNKCRNKVQVLYLLLDAVIDEDTFQRRA
eukprot:TRINITY_DN58157_c0_g1_i1.p1 TRINITY_DN58157_c0_g1~~TRINITY_DN58157_c0_g1_i1.p1  ORF type:complete len:359 (+),score=96.99 TRINITY_DN58157_c0_g1_i1:134-1078(+)